MNTEEKVSRLRGLLERIRTNSERPRRALASSVTVASRPASEAERHKAEEVEEELVLLDDDIVEVSESAAPPPVQAAAPRADSIDFEEEEEEEAKPASSRRARALETTVDELEEVSASLDDVEHEIPIKTPPPESGPQSATPAPAVAEPGAVHAAESDLAAISGAPTVEQLGQTIDLEESEGPPLELAPPAEPEPPPPPEELEASLFVLESREPAVTHAAPEVMPPEVMPPEPGPASPPVQSKALEAAAVQRPAASDVVVVEHLGAPRDFRPASFLELLDASLGLGQ